MTARPLVIYHANCPDGFGAAWCFWRLYGDCAEYYPGVYQVPPPDVTDRRVFCVDFSYKRDVMERLLAQADSVTLIDHHKSAIEDLAGLPGLFQFVDLERSGAKLAWDYLFPDESAPWLIDHIEDADLWRFRLPDTKKIFMSLTSRPYDFDEWTTLMGGSVTLQTVMKVEGEAIERKHFRDIDELLKVCKRTMWIDATEVPVASLPYTMVSDAANRMAHGVPFAACYWDTPHTRTFGLRSVEGGRDVSEVAKRYGGGGHKHAAGFSVPRNHPLACS